MASDDSAWTGERVAERTVMNHWLATEARKRAVATPEPAPARASGDQLVGLLEDRRTGDRERLDDDLAALDDHEVLDALLREKPGAAAFLWRARPIEWLRIELTQAAFERVRYVPGPDDLGWRALAPSGRVIEGARRIAASDRATLETQTGVDLERVCEMAATLAEGGQLGALVLTRRRGQRCPAVTDGNHRATAIALHWLRTGEYHPQRAYLGTGANPVMRPLCERVRGALSRLRSSEPRW